jgi:hypothetical protein
MCFINRLDAHKEASSIEALLVTTQLAFVEIATWGHAKQLWAGLILTF